MNKEKVAYTECIFNLQQTFDSTLKYILYIFTLEIRNKIGQINTIHPFSHKFHFDIPDI